MGIDNISRPTSHTLFLVHTHTVCMDCVLAVLLSFLAASSPSTRNAVASTSLTLRTSSHQLVIVAHTNFPQFSATGTITVRRTRTTSLFAIHSRDFCDVFAGLSTHPLHPLSHTPSPSLSPSLSLTLSLYHTHTGLSDESLDPILFPLVPSLSLFNCVADGMYLQLIIN